MTLSFYQSCCIGTTVLQCSSLFSGIWGPGMPHLKSLFFQNAGQLKQVINGELLCRFRNVPQRSLTWVPHLLLGTSASSNGTCLSKFYMRNNYVIANVKTQKRCASHPSVKWACQQITLYIELQSNYILQENGNSIYLHRYIKQTCCTCCKHLNIV